MQKLRENYQKIIPILHFIISFFWEKVIFINPGSEDTRALIARNDSISYQTETTITYILSRIICFILIWLIWKLIFYISSKKIERSDLIILGVIYFIVLITGIIVFPDLFGIDIDNYTNYSTAIRFLPTYWHSIYTGALYAGCLMVIPHPISLFIFQWSLFFGVVSYIYLGVKKLYPDRFLKYFPLLFLLLPESYYLIFNAYRNNYYAVLVMFYIAYIFFRALDQNINERGIDIVKFSLLTSFVMIWRSEGILIGVGGLIVYLFNVLRISKANFKRIVMLAIAVIISFGGLSKIQNMGDEKFYGQDYMILNTTPVLYSILNNPNANFTYPSAEADLQAIGQVTPVEMLREYGMDGYRNYNWTMGHQDFNQTLASDSAANAYMKAYYSIIIHNPQAYLDVQINSFYSALQLSANHTTYSYTGEYTVELTPFVYSPSNDEIMQTWKTERWTNDDNRIILSGVLKEIMAVWRELFLNTNLNAMMHSGLILLISVIILYRIMSAIENRSLKYPAFCFAFIMWFAEMVAIMLFMPEGRAAYLYPLLYAGYLLVFLYVLIHKVKTADILRE